MKALLPGEFKGAPVSIQYLYICAMNDFPVGSSILDEAMENHPEYFPDELAQRAKWDAIPSEVHDAYAKEYVELMKMLPQSPGLLKLAVGGEEADEYFRKEKKVGKEFESLSRELHDKYYGPYGIEFNGW